MATTKFTVYGHLGYEVVIDGSVITQVLFALVDENQTSLAWYGFRASPSRWRSNQFDAYFHPGIGNISSPGFGNAAYKDPEGDDNFGTADHGGTMFLYPGQFSVAGLVSRSGIARAADLQLKDQGTRLTACILSVPSVQPMSAMLTFNLRTVKKRRTPDLTKDGIIDLIEIVPFRNNTLMTGPNLANLRQRGFRNHVEPLIHEQRRR